MKKTVLFLLIATALSCKQQSDVKPIQKNFTAGKPRALAGADGAYDVLGYGVDATRDYNDPNSVSESPIINVTQFANDYASQLDSYIDKNDVTAGVDSFYYGSNAVNYSMQLTTSKGLSVGLSSNGKSPFEVASTPTTTTTGTSTITGNNLFTASFSKNTSDQTSNAYSSSYSYASEEVTQRVRRLAFTGNVTVNMLMNYLTPAFVNDVNTLSADDLVARYGTHVLLDISLGGVLKFNYSAITADQTNSSNNTSDLKIGLGAAVNKAIAINIGYDASSATVTSVMNASKNKLYTMQYYGGNTAGQTIAFDSSGNPSQTISLGSWESSINVNNCTIVGVGNALYIYDFISDPVKKAAVMAAVQRHIAAAQVTVVTPIISTWYPNTKILLAGQSVYSQNLQYRLTLQANDGNLVLYNKAGIPLWATGKMGGNTLLFAGNNGGELEVTNSSNSIIWSAPFLNTSLDITGYTTAFYTLQNDGNFVLYYNGQAIKATGTANGVRSPHYNVLQ